MYVKSFRLFAIRLIVGLAVAAVAFPGSSAQAADTPIKGDGGKVRVLSNPVGTQSWPVHVLQKFNLAKKYGFELEIIPTSTTQTTNVAFRSNSADIGNLQWPDLMRLRNTGLDIIAISPLFELGGDYIVVPKDSPIKTLADFKGKRFGVTTRASVNWLLTQAAGKKLYNMDVDKDSVVREASVSLLVAMSEQGDLDGSHIFNNLAPEMVASGKFRFMTQMRTMVKEIGLPRTPFLMWSANMSFLKAHPENAKAFNAAYRESIEILNKDDAVWAERGKELQMSPMAIQILRDEMREDLWTKFTSTTEADIRQTFETFLSVSGPELMGFSEMPPGFVTLDYQ